MDAQIDGESDFLNVEMPPLPAHITRVPMPIYNHVFNGIYAPTNDAQRQQLVELFRDEIYQDWNNDLLRLMGVYDDIDAHDHDIAQLSDAIEHKVNPVSCPGSPLMTSYDKTGAGETTPSTLSK